MHNFICCSIIVLTKYSNLIVRSCKTVNLSWWYLFFCHLFLVPETLPDPKVVRINGRKDINVTWNAIIPDHTKGEGYVYRYDIRYYQFDDVDNSIVVEGKNTTEYRIMGVGENVEYTVQVRVVVINSTEPTLTFQFGTWGGKQLQKPIGEMLYM